MGVPKGSTMDAESIAIGLLQKATLARSAGLRAKYATKGLEQPSAEPSTQVLLLRQLYLAHMEASEFEEALLVAQQMIEVGILPDVARQDAARACLGTGAVDRALEHLRIASRVAPASRRAFHLWTLGSALYLVNRPEEAVGILSRAARWGTTAKPLYLAQLALAHIAAGDDVDGIAELREQLEAAACGQGYGQFVLGELAFEQGDYAAAKRYLTGFIRRTTTGRVALAVGLSAEIERARRLLEHMAAIPL